MGFIPARLFNLSDDISHLNQAIKHQAGKFLLFLAPVFAFFFSHLSLPPPPPLKVTIRTINNNVYLFLCNEKKNQFQQCIGIFTTITRVTRLFPSMFLATIYRENNMSFIAYYNRLSAIYGVCYDFR